ncbi:hypothetical protein IP92_02932 [Pseudoduganella flava]|uniref:Uncharacterized protein n=1 Tax=Pseudoduganella flava TaxID=871742 RepID=A0A562PQF1_9BURK|nr:hypothetical protein [Pseudoduganella flava]QGZ37764.1 hypothetical protein GO485_00960 [Pseudoduganella flava]TWI46573.1 hypothetical protein IP92_02932 [Pseudoduganella flava]
MTPEEAQLLVNQGAAIDAGAAAELADAVAPAGAVVAGPAVDPAAEWMFVPELVTMVVTIALPEAAPAYTPEAQHMLATKIAAVAEKRGWNGMSSSPEISLGLASVAFAMPAFMAYKARQIAAAEAEGQGGATLNGKPVINGGTDGDR